KLADHPLIDRVGVVVPVAPFGRPVAQAPWKAFAQKTGVKIVIDGAASFDTVLTSPERCIADIPVAFSFHATKSFGTGEGGAIATSDVGLAERVTQALNFGFYGTRDSRVANTNGKMSEFHAAVGLAELDGWTEKHSAMRSVVAHYQRISGEAGLSERLLTWP